MVQSSRHLFVVLLVFLYCAGCEIKEKQPLEIQVNGSKDKQTPIGFNIELRPGTIPNHYQVELNWDESLNFGHLYKSTNASIPERIEPETSHNNQATDKSVVPGNNYRYWIWNDLSEGPALHSPGFLEVFIPKDIVIDTPTEIGSIDTNGQIFILGTSLFASKRGLTIRTPRIFFKNSKIYSFQNESEDGSPGVPIKINAKEAQGELTVFALGNPGNEGKRGEPGKDGSAGEHGLAAEIEEAITLTQDPGNKSSITSVFRNSARREKKHFRCKMPPTDGANGKDAENGKNGDDGGNGGDSSPVWIEIESGESLAIDYRKIPGEGGKGGPGGKGGTGGAGGIAGANDEWNVCPPAKNGAPGNPGNEGLPGKVGLRGSSLPVCIINGSSRVGECDKIETYFWRF